MPVLPVALASEGGPLFGSGEARIVTADMEREAGEALQFDCDLEGVCSGLFPADPSIDQPQIDVGGFRVTAPHSNGGVIGLTEVTESWELHLVDEQIRLFTDLGQRAFHPWEERLDDLADTPLALSLDGAPFTPPDCAYDVIPDEEGELELELCLGPACVVFQGEIEGLDCS